MLVGQLLYVEEEETYNEVVCILTGAEHYMDLCSGRVFDRRCPVAEVVLLFVQ